MINLYLRSNAMTNMKATYFGSPIVDNCQKYFSVRGFITPMSGVSSQVDTDLNCSMQTQWKHATRY